MESMFTDDEHQSAGEKMKVLNNFKRILADRSLDKMNRVAYQHFHLRCGDIAHYNINGYRAYYSGSKFLEFLDLFVHPRWIEPSDINKVLIELARAEYPKIVQEFAREEHNRKVAAIQALATELGYRIVPKDAEDSSEEAVLCAVGEGGQLRLLV
ncbi:MAG: hypothetical protein K6T83_12250 [Alicyclobacillus sp.]|nr:hypothetical protein [Alicyclobacillus sp.]